MLAKVLNKAFKGLVLALGLLLKTINLVLLVLALALRYLLVLNYLSIVFYILSLGL